MVPYLFAYSIRYHNSSRLYQETRSNAEVAAIMYYGPELWLGMLEEAEAEAVLYGKSELKLSLDSAIIIEAVQIE